MIPEMNTSRKAMEWLICFPIVNLMLGCLSFKRSKNLMNLGRKVGEILSWRNPNVNAEQNHLALTLSF